MPKISVVVTVYNIAAYLPRFFDSMKNQTFEDYKLLVIDDGSEDDSLAVCRQYAEKDPRIVVHHLEHVGISAARNYSMELLDTEYTVHADGDDYVEPGYLEHLFGAAQKYNADLVISRVVYRNEKTDVVSGGFQKLGERLIQKSDFPVKIPDLLDQSRLNYLYGKIFKTEFFKECRVEPDVKQGSDTMINCQYITKIKNIAIIDDADYNYIKYSTRSVTSYSGKDAFSRLLRINDTISIGLDKAGYMNEKMTFVVDKRILQSAVWTIEKILKFCKSKNEKEKQIDAILKNERYKIAFDRVKKFENYQERLDFEPIEPQSGKSYLRKVYRENRIVSIKGFILSICPKFIKEKRVEKREEKDGAA